MRFLDLGTAAIPYLQFMAAPFFDGIFMATQREFGPLVGYKVVTNERPA
jgi:hypothetical protein